jgi:hypothetical protein
VIDDIVYLKGDDVPTEYRLSELLTEGCNGPHWVGHGNESTKSGISKRAIGKTK